MDLRILGPLEVEVGGRLAQLGGPKQRAVLAILALDPGRTVSTTRIVDAIWGIDAPESAGKTLHVYISNLRKALEPDRTRGSAPIVLLTRDPGYVLDVDPGSVDAVRLERALAAARLDLDAGRPSVAVASIRSVLAERRGEPLLDFVDLPFHRDEAGRLAALDLDARECLVDAELAAGRPAEILPLLDEMIRAEPFREHFHAQRMLALYRCGRQRDALVAYETVRRAFVEELGLDPGAALQDLRQRVLDQDPSLSPPVKKGSATRPDRSEPAQDPSEVEASPRIEAGGDRLSDAGQITRKRLSVIAAHRRTSGDEDPERSESAFSQWSARIEEVAQGSRATPMDRHANHVTLVFGAPRRHLDDADRAAFLALALATRDDVAGVGLATGLAAVRGTQAAGPVLARAVDLSARASAGQVAVDPGTVDVLGGRAEVLNEPLRLVGLRAGTPSFTPFVGRESELAILQSCWQHVIARRRLMLCSIGGELGVGRSRLAEELTRWVGATSSSVWRFSPGTESSPPEAGGPLAQIADVVEGGDASLIVLDDLDCATPALRANILRALNAAVDRPLFVVAAHGPAPTPLFDGPLTCARVHLDLGPLDDESARRLAIEVRAETVGALDEPIHADLVSLAAGNPFLIGALASATGNEIVPELVDQRLDRVTLPVRRAIEVLAVLEHGDLGTLARIEPGAAEAIIEAGIAGFVDLDDERLRFHHEIVRLAVLESIGLERRVELHLAAASELGDGADAARHVRAAALDLRTLSADAERTRAVALTAAGLSTRLAWRTIASSDTYRAIELFGDARDLVDTSSEFVRLVREAYTDVATAALQVGPVRDQTPGGGMTAFSSAVSFDAPARAIPELRSVAEAVSADPYAPASVVRVAADLRELLGPI